jgi:hypothetical protein
MIVKVALEITVILYLIGFYHNFSEKEIFANECKNARRQQVNFSTDSFEFQLMHIDNFSSKSIFANKIKGKRRRNRA